MPPTEFRVMFVAMDGDCVDPKSHNRGIKPLKICLVQRNSSSHQACCNPFQQKDHPGIFSPFVKLTVVVHPFVFQGSDPITVRITISSFWVPGSSTFCEWRSSMKSYWKTESSKGKRPIWILLLWQRLGIFFSWQNELAGGCFIATGVGTLLPGVGGVFLWYLKVSWCSI